MSNKVSISTIDKIIKEMNFGEDVVINWHGVDLTVHTYIKFSDVMTIVKDVTNSCISNDNGEYIPEVKDFMIRYDIINYYTNVRLPEDVSKSYMFLYKTDLYDSVYEVIHDTDIFKNIIRSIDEKISYVSSLNISMVENEMRKGVECIANIADSFKGVTQDDIKNLLVSLSNNSLDENNIVNAYINAIQDNNK